MQTTNNIFMISSAIETKIEGKLVDDTEQVLGKTKLLGVKREQNPPQLTLPKKQKVPILDYIYACNFVMSYTSDVTNGANQSSRLNGFIGTNIISIRKAQRKLHQVTSGVWQL